MTKNIFFFSFLLITVSSLIIIAGCNKTKTHVDVGWAISGALTHPTGSTFIMRDSATGVHVKFIEGGGSDFLS